MTIMRKNASTVLRRALATRRQSIASRATTVAIPQPQYDASTHVPIPRLNTKVVHTKLRGLQVIQNPMLNRGTGFSASERERLGLRGLVPPRCQGLEQQMSRVMHSLKRCATPLDKHQYLSGLMDRNTTLFYRILMENFAELAPIIYTPTVGQACLNFHANYCRTRGMYFSIRDKGHFASMVYNWQRDVDVIVVTDGSRILALGDLGSNGMNIPIGKLALYTAGGGINPARTLPVLIDVGTNNAELRENPLYNGETFPRVKGEEYFAVIDEWMMAVRARWPNVLVQFEDFSSDVALPILNKYRNTQLCFNDDVQSTGVIALASVLGSLRARGLSMSDLKNERIVCVGAGSAGLGVCTAIFQGMLDDGASEAEAASRFYIVDKDGLLGVGRSDVPEAGQRFLRGDLPSGLSLESTISAARPTVLLGLSGVGGLFSEGAVREMARHVERPVVLPLSNPLDASECTAAQAFEWTGGRALFASGSPFDDVALPDGGLGIANQCNNVFSFPGLGLAVTALRIARVSDGMMLAAARRIAELNDDAIVQSGRLLPRIDNLRDVSLSVAEAVGLAALNEGLAKIPVPRSGLYEYLHESMWVPDYAQYVADDSH